MMKRMSGFKKNRNKTKRKILSFFNIGSICIVLVAAFGLLGASYAFWNQSFSFYGSINTGEVSVVVRDVVLESSDSYEQLSHNVDMTGNIVEQVNMDVITEASPFNMVIIFIVENIGAIPVICEEITSSEQDNPELQLLDSPTSIDVGQTASIRVRMTEGYREDFEFSTFLKFVQATY
jgi:hypothetical protein